MNDGFRNTHTYIYKILLSEEIIIVKGDPISFSWDLHITNYKIHRPLYIACFTIVSAVT